MEKKINLKKVSIGILGVAVLGFMLFSMYTQFMSLQLVKEDISKEELLITKAEKNLKALKSLKEQEELMLAHVKLLDEAMPPSADEYGAILYIQEALQFPDSEVIDIRFSDRVSNGDYSEMPVKVGYEGYYHGLVTFLDNLQNGSRIVRIDGVKIARGSEGFPQIKADIDMSTFYTDEK
ncbi:MAG: hypothetical protein APF76_08060 [Desulfitibacter sp. BRH_c19]|nr:MAG: hypothetical protein APF76_08060 [Desulfitibacter sp. BRH_c19]